MGGRAEREAPCHCMWHKSGMTVGDRKVRRMREHASLGARRAQTQATRSRSGSWRNKLCCETAMRRKRSSSDPERRSTPFHQRGCLVRGRDTVGRRRERRDALSKKTWVRELKRESRVEARAGKSGRGHETWARETGATQRNCDDKKRPQLTSHAHGARKKGGLSWETEKPGELRSTTCRQKKAGGNREAQVISNWNQSGQ